MRGRLAVRPLQLPFVSLAFWLDIMGSQNRALRGQNLPQNMHAVAAWVSLGKALVGQAVPSPPWLCLSRETYLGGG